MPFIDDDFLLHYDTARELYHQFAKDEPIYDYHCHLPPADIAANRRFPDLASIWLAGDHYKWRAMRTNGVREELITGGADPWEKFQAWAETVPHTLRNPLYHWTHFELKRYFGIDTLLNGETAREIWDEANRQLKERDDLTPHGILKQFQVVLVGTTDDPADTLEHHKTIAQSDLETRVYPAFRPDAALKVENPEGFKSWLEQLAKVSGRDTTTFDGMVEALRDRHEFFHEMGSRLSDHGLETAYADDPDEAVARKVFADAIAGDVPDEKAADQYRSWLMLFFGHLDAEKGWTKQLHLGAMRNNNERLFKQCGPDSGFDSMGDFTQGRALSRYLNRLDRDGRCPKIVLYNLNPVHNYLFATMIGNFQDGSVPGKMQFGSGWWFNDQIEGMTDQMNALSNCGLLSRFVGMLTDSRSFLSYPRHEYFRRLLCQLLGEDVEKGYIPRDMELVGGMVRNICFHNAKNYFGMEL